MLDTATEDAMIRIKGVVHHQQRDRDKICIMNCIMCRSPCVKQGKYAPKEMSEGAMERAAERCDAPTATPLPFPRPPARE